MLRRTTALAVTAALLAVACSDSADQVTTTPTTETTTSTESTESTESTIQTTSPPPTSHVGDPSQPRWAQFDVDGAEVWSTTTQADLADSASIVRFATTVIDSGDGPVLCLAGTEDSLPPQCGGPVAVGLDMTSGWVRVDGGVRWGDRVVTVTWPPLGGAVELIADVAVEDIPRPEPPPELDSVFAAPAGCPPKDRWVDVETLNRYAGANPDRTSIVYVVDGNRQGVLQVSDDIEVVRAELTTNDREPCLQQVEYSTTELRNAAERLGLLMRDETLGFSGMGTGNIHNRITIDLAVADRSTVAVVAAAVDDPAMLRIVGAGTILG